MSLNKQTNCNVKRTTSSFKTVESSYPPQTIRDLAFAHE